MEIDKFTQPQGQNPEGEYPPTKVSSALNFAAIIGLALGVLTILIYLLEAYNSSSLNTIFSILTNTVFIAGIILGIKRRRDYELGGNITFGEGVGYGTLLALFASIIVAFTMYIYLEFVDGSFIEYVIETQKEAYYNAGMEGDEIEAMIKIIQNFMGPAMLAFTTVLGYLIMGLLTSLVTAFFLKKENINFENYN